MNQSRLLLIIGIVLVLGAGFTFPAFSRASGDGVPSVIPDGARAVSVRVNHIIGVADSVLPGTRVDVIRTGKLPDGGGKVVSRIILENVRVLAAGRSIEQSMDGRPHNVWVVTLLVTSEQAQELTLAGSDRIQIVVRK